jgi:flagellar basal body-associated protein FliL
MAEEAKKKAEAPEKAAPAADKGAEKKDHGKAAGGGMLSKTPVLIGGAMILEAVILFAGLKFLGGGAPHTAQGADLAAPDESHDSDPADEGHDKEPAASSHDSGDKASSSAPAIDKKASYEVEVIKDRFLNRRSGRTFFYDVSIVAVVKGTNQERATKTIEQRKALITDRVRTIIAQSDPEKLGGGSEPGLETLRRQVKYQLEDIVGENVIEEVLVPRCLPFRTDY